IRKVPGDMRNDLRSARQVSVPNGSTTPFMRRASGSSASLAIPRFYDPMEFWDLSGLPWNMADEGHRHKLQKWARLFYATHYLVPILVDIFTRFPLAGMNISHSDQYIEDFYSTVFIDNMKFEETLLHLGREHWLSGEAMVLGSFDESLGVWG